jgi:hypothetical protein
MLLSERAVSWRIPAGEVGPSLRLRPPLSTGYRLPRALIVPLLYTADDPPRKPEIPRDGTSEGAGPTAHREPGVVHRATGAVSSRRYGDSGRIGETGDLRMAPVWDLLIRGATIIDPAQSIAATRNVAFGGGRVAAAADTLASGASLPDAPRDPRRPPPPGSSRRPPVITGARIPRPAAIRRHMEPTDRARRVREARPQSVRGSGASAIIVRGRAERAPVRDNLAAKGNADGPQIPTLR